MGKNRRGNLIKSSYFNEVRYGIFSKTVDSALVEVTGHAGIDFIILDMEHGPASVETMHHHVRAAKLGGALSIIRVKGLDAHAIGSALDTGANGIQVPNISTSKQAREAVSAARYYPKGQRGVCRFVRAANFGEQDREEYFHQANDKLVILQVEGIEGVKNLDKILEVEGFDVLFIGPYDLSQSIGKPGEVESEEVLDLMQEIAIKAKKKGIILGAFSDNISRNKSLKKQGFNYIAYSVDLNIYLEACKTIIKE